MFNLASWSYKKEVRSGRSCMELFRINHFDPKALESERQRVHSMLAECCLPGRLIEVGSTAVPGLVGKQDLDFLVLVTAADFSVARQKLDQLLDRNPLQLSNEQYQGYKVKSSMDVAIQLTIEGSPYDTFLGFLECLKVNPEVREKYNRLKQTYDGKPMHEYREAKSAFIESTLSSRQSRKKEALR